MSNLEQITVGIAIYAAILSTSLAIWDIYKYKTRGAKLRIHVAKDKVVYPDYAEGDETLWISISVTNVGDQPITLTSLSVAIFENWIDRVRKKPKGDVCYSLPNPVVHKNLPLKLEPGEEWRPLVKQNAPNIDLDIGQESENNFVIFEISTSNRTKPYRARLR